MTRERFEHLFGKHEQYYVQFEQIDNPLHNRPDLAAFLLLAELCPGSGDIIGAAEHDEVYLSIDVEKGLLPVVTEENIIYLLRCGVSYREECLRMVV